MSDINDVKALLKRIKELNLQAESLREQRNTLNFEAKKWADRRDILNNNNKAARNELKMHRSKRDEANETVKRLKEERSEISTQMDAKREEYNTLRDKINKLLGRTSQSLDVVKRQINRLDWKIQTNPLSAVEENEIIEQIRLLEKEKLFHKEAAMLKDRLIELKAELGALRIKRSEIHNQICEFVDISRGHHDKMLKKMSEAKPLINEADDAHRKYLEYERSADEAHRKYLETIEQIKIADANIKEIESTEFNKLLSKQVELVREVAYEKLKNGKKLTFDEFKLLKEKGLI